LLKKGIEMMTNKTQMTANNHFLHVKVGPGFPIGNMEEEALRGKAIRFYWDIFRLLHKNQEWLRNQDLTRSLRLSFEDDFDEDQDEENIAHFDEDEYSDDDVFLPAESSFLEEDSLFEEEDEMDLKDELYYK
jgi:hypothetical protein